MRPQDNHDKPDPAVKGDLVNPFLDVQIVDDER